MTPAEIEAVIVGWIDRQLDIECSAESNFAALGLDSLDAVELTEVLAEQLGLEEVPISWILDHPTPRSLALRLAQP
jgi:acyl carrier protein